MRDIPMEAAAIGLILLIIFVIIHVAMMSADRTFSMSHPGIFLGVFLTGALGHAAFEVTGQNKAFCKKFDSPATA